MLPRASLLGWLALAAALVAASLFRSIDHDEGQYVAAVALMRHSLPYRDFAYLQTPLQPLLFAPLAWACEGWLFPALRMVNALLAAAAIAVIAHAARAAEASPRGACLAALALATSHMALFAATVARNDALPLLLHIIGLWLFVPVAREGEAGSARRAMLAGLMLGAAASAKINYGLPAAAVGLFALLRWRILGIRVVLALVLGGLLGGLPTALLWSLAPDAARFGIIDYGLRAPVEWRTLNGQAFMLQAPLSLLRLARFLAQGLGLIALIAILCAIVRKRRGREPVALLLDLMILAGLLAAWLPRPVYVQYLGPLLPALFIRFALLSDGPFWRGMAGQGLIGLLMVAGMAQTVADVAGNAVRGVSPALATAAEARAIGARVRAAGARGQIVTLSPERVVDSGLALDPRLATGLFLFRTRSVLTAAEARAFHALTARNAFEGLDASRPAAILTGFEGLPSPAAPHGLDAPLVAWARARGYRAQVRPPATLYIRPPNPAGPKPLRADAKM